MGDAAERSEAKRMKRTFYKYWPIFFLILFWFVFSSPFFLKNRVPYPSNYQVNFFAPWRQYDKYWGPVKNNAMPDVIDQIYPWKYLTINSLKEGVIPYWNPYNFAGNPHLANFQTAVLSPFNILFFLLQFLDAWSILVLIQPLLAGLFMYFFLREIDVGKEGAAFGSIAFMFCGFIVVWMAYGTLSMAIAFLPLVFFAIERSFRKRTIFSLALVTVSIVLSFFSGHFQTSLYLLLSSLAYFLFRTITTRDRKAALWIMLCIILGVAISLLQLLPSINFYTHAVRSEIFISQGGGIPWHYFVTLFAPDFYGNPVTRNDWFGYYAEWASFVGILPLVLSIVAVFQKKNSYRTFFLLFAVLTLGLAMESPLLSVIGSLKIPVLSTSTPSRIVVLLSFAIAVLSGLGLDRLKELIMQRKYKVLLPVVLALTLLLLLIWIAVMFLPIMSTDKIEIAKRNLILPSAIFASLLFLIVSNLVIRRKYILFISIGIIFFLSAIDSLRYAQKWMPFDERQYVFPDTQIVNAIQKRIGNGRIFGNLGTQVESYYKFSSIEGYDPLYVQQYGEFVRSANTGEFAPAERSVVRVDRRGKYVDRLLDLLNVTLIFHPRADTHQGWAFPVWEQPEKYNTIYKDDRFELYKNTSAMNRVTLFYNYEVIHDNKAQLRRFYDPAFAFRKILLLSENPGIQPIQDEDIKGEAQVVSYTSNKIIVRVKTSSPAILFLSDTYYPKWKVRVNGKIKKLLRADYAFRGVVVPSGKSIVEFFYQEYF